MTNEPYSSMFGTGIVPEVRGLFPMLTMKIHLKTCMAGQTSEKQFHNSR